MYGIRRLRSLKDVATMSGKCEDQRCTKVENIQVVLRLPSDLAGASGPFTGVRMDCAALVQRRGLHPLSGRNRAPSSRTRGYCDATEMAPKGGFRAVEHGATVACSIRSIYRRKYRCANLKCMQLSLKGTTVSWQSVRNITRLRQQLESVGDCYQVVVRQISPSGCQSEFITAVKIEKERS